MNDIEDADLDQLSKARQEHAIKTVSISKIGQIHLLKYLNSHQNTLKKYHLLVFTCNLRVSLNDLILTA